jgi:hypothetical protein
LLQYLFRFRFLVGGTIPGALRVRRSNYRDRGNPGQAFRARGRRTFLAFPAIFPASATLVAKHETQKKQKAGIATSSRGRQAAALDAAGAALRTVGLAGFALTVWKLLPRYNSAFVFLAATAVWLALAILSWRIWKKHLCR